MFCQVWWAGVSRVSMPGQASGNQPGENCKLIHGRGADDVLAAMRAPMSVRVISRRIDARQVSIKMVDGSLVRGKVNIFHGEEVVQRVSDIFTKISDPFVVVFDVTAEGKSGRVLIVNKRNISWVSPEDEPVQKQSQEAQEDEKPAGSKGSWMERMRSS
jgi:hypothetical protein